MALFGNDYDRDYGYRGTHRDHGGGMMDRAGNSLRRGWNNVRDRFDGDHDRGWQGGARDGYGMEADNNMRGSWDRGGANGFGNSGYGNAGYGNTGYGATGFGNTGWGTSGYATGRNDFNDYDRDFGNRGTQFGGGGGMNSGFGGARESFHDDSYRGGAYGTGYGNAGPAYGAGSNMAYDRDYGYRGNDYDRSNAGSYGYDRNMKSRSQTDNGDPFGDRSAHTPIRVMRGPYERSGMGIDYDRQYKEGLGDDPYYNRNDPSSGGMYRGSAGMYDRNYRDDNRGWF